MVEGKRLGASTVDGTERGSCLGAETGRQIHKDCGQEGGLDGGCVRRVRIICKDDCSCDIVLRVRTEVDEWGP